MRVRRDRPLQRGRVRTSGEGSLYPALHRLVRVKQLKAEWGTSEHNRKARFYTLTATGRRRSETDTARWRSVSSAVTAALACSEVHASLRGAAWVG